MGAAVPACRDRQTLCVSALAVFHSTVYRGHGHGAAVVVVSQPALQPRCTRHWRHLAAAGHVVWPLCRYRDLAPDDPCAYTSHRLLPGPEYDRDRNFPAHPRTRRLFCGPISAARWITVCGMTTARFVNCPALIGC